VGPTRELEFEGIGYGAVEDPETLDDKVKGAEPDGLTVDRLEVEFG
jgi:hypothetical protein